VTESHRLMADALHRQVHTREPVWILVRLSKRAGEQVACLLPSEQHLEYDFEPFGRTQRGLVPCQGYHPLDRALVTIRCILT